MNNKQTVMLIIGINWQMKQLSKEFERSKWESLKRIYKKCTTWCTLNVFKNSMGKTAQSQGGMTELSPLRSDSSRDCQTKWENFTKPRDCPNWVRSDQMVLRTVRQEAGSREKQPKTLETNLAKGGPSGSCLLRSDSSHNGQEGGWITLMVASGAQRENGKQL
jgi:hypothetical protein